jgi:hypothetical protein
MAQIAPVVIATGHSPVGTIMLVTHPERRDAEGAGAGDVSKCT